MGAAMNRKMKIITIPFLALLIGTLAFAQPPRPSESWKAAPARARQNIQPVFRPALDSSPFIRNMVNAVSSDSMLRTIQDLQDFSTRFEYTPQRDQAAEYLLERLRALGYEAESDWYAIGMADFYDLAHAGADSIWAISVQGNIVRSMDHGATWQSLLAIPEKEPLYGIDFLTSTEGWVCGYWGNLYRTRDGGNSWTKTEFEGKPHFWDIAFLSTGVVLACGERGALYRNENNGEVWQKLNLNTTDSFWYLYEYDDANIWLCGYNGSLYFSSDRGKTWKSRLQNRSYYLNSVSFISPEEGWVAGEKGLMLHTVDGGAVWKVLDTNLPASTLPRDIIMSDRLHGRLITVRGQILSTSDGGKRWDEEFSLFNLGWGPNLYQIDRTQDGSLIACGSQGVLLINTDGENWTSCTERLPDSMIRSSRNILAARKGTVAPEREVVMVAHYDSYSDDPYNHAPGANDNASGTSAVLEAARLCRDYELGATLKFLLVSGEELGMFGSTHFVKEARAEKREVLAAVNGDMIGYPLTGNPARLVTGSYLTRNRLIDSAMVYNARYGIGATLDEMVDSTGASDYGPFAAAGYDALEIAEGRAEDIWGGLDPYYHTTADMIDKLSPGLIQKGAQIMLATAAEAAGVVGQTSVAGPPLSAPECFSLAQNYPNPFNASTRIDFTLPRSTRVILKIYNMHGEEVATLLARQLGAGNHTIRWNALGQPSGTYFCRLSAEGWSGEKKILLLR
jgi:photosystem II stability/assembly factor-like uncharacterized protein